MDREINRPGPRRERQTQEMTRTSRYISMLLRHRPEVAGLTLDAHGWADVDALIAGVNKTHFLTRELLEEIVRLDEKGRYSFNSDKTKIRANQGHSIPVDVELEQKTPPEVLWHGTGEKYVASIEEKGLLPKSRLYVHLSPDRETALTVGRRHGRPVIFRVLARRMHDDDFPFYLSVNGVWLTKSVPVRYLARDEEK